MNFSLKIIKKGVIYRTNIACWNCSEVLQRIFILFDTDVLKMYKFPSFEQTHHLELDFVKHSKQPVHMEVYQEFLFLNSNCAVLIVDIISQNLLFNLSIGADITNKLLKTEVKAIPILVEESLYILLSASSGVVLMARCRTGNLA